MPGTASPEGRPRGRVRASASSRAINHAHHSRRSAPSANAPTRHAAATSATGTHGSHHHTRPAALAPRECPSTSRTTSPTALTSHTSSPHHWSGHRKTAAPMAARRNAGTHVRRDPPEGAPGGEPRPRMSSPFAVAAVVLLAASAAPSGPRAGEASQAVHKPSNSDRKWSDSTPTPRRPAGPRPSVPPFPIATRTRPPPVHGRGHPARRSPPPPPSPRSIARPTRPSQPRPVEASCCEAPPTVREQRPDTPHPRRHREDHPSNPIHRPPPNR